MTLTSLERRLQRIAERLPQPDPEIVDVGRMYARTPGGWRDVMTGDVKSDAQVVALGGRQNLLVLLGGSDDV